MSDEQQPGAPVGLEPSGEAGTDLDGTDLAGAPPDREDLDDTVAAGGMAGGGVGGTAMNGAGAAAPSGLATTTLAYRFDDTVTLPETGAPAEVPAGFPGDAITYGAPAYGGPVYGANAIVEDDPWPSHAVRRGIHMNWLTAGLVVLLIAAGAFWGGAAVQKSRGGATTAGAAASRLRSLFAGAGATGSSATRGAGSGASSFFRGGAGGSTAAATGEVTAVVGNTLYITTSSGTLVKVVVGSSTKVTRDASVSASSLKQGDTVVVEGTTAKDGTVTASSVSATAAGTASSGFGGFGGAGG